MPAGNLENLGYQDLTKRLLTEETCRKYKYQVGSLDGKPVQVAQYENAVKVRFPDKSFSIIGEGRKNLGLFGQQLFNGGKQLVITEGEIDALTMSQVQGNKWPVVSVPNGAQGAAKAIKKNVDWVSKFDKVVFMFDMDEAGQKAAKECAALLRPGTAYIASLPRKDPNECLVHGDGNALVDAMWNAKAYRPDGIVSVDSVAEQASKPIERGLSWPWGRLTEKTYGRRRSELYGFGGGTGCGKSTIFKQVALHIINEDQLPVGMLMLEEPPAHTLKTLAGMQMKTRVHVPDVEYSTEELVETIHALEGKVYFYDHFGAATFDTISEKIRFMVTSLGIKDVFLDHLTALAATVDTDERKAIDKIMAELSSLTQELDCTIYYISHLSTPDSKKSHEEGARVMERHFRGSRSIGYWSHFLFGIERDKQNLAGVTTFRVLKDRYTGDANGLTFGLSYDKDSGLLEQCDLPSEGGDFKDNFPDGEF